MLVTIASTTSGADRPKIIIIAAKLEYSKANALRIGKKLFTETWFTDQQTGEYLSGMESPVGARFSRSAVQANAEVRTDFTVAEGETVLVHGGTSGIGTMAISLCKLFGLKVIVTAGSDEKVAACLAHGADHAINYKTEDFVARVKDLTEGRGVDVVLDMVGGDYVPRNLKCLAEDGRHVSIAVQGGLMATIPIFDIMRRRLTLTGSTLRPRDTAFKSLVADELHSTVWPHVEAGRLKPVMDRTFPLAEAPAAHARMEAGEHVGKIVLTLD